MEIWKLLVQSLVILVVIVVAMLGTATKLQTARNIKLHGAVNGNVNFDGNEDVTINTTQDNIAVLTGNVTINASSSNSVQISYPSGYTKDNSILLACGLMLNNDPYSKGYNYYGIFSDASDLLDYAYRRRVNLASDKILLFIQNPITDNAITVKYKLVLMKIS